MSNQQASPPLYITPGTAFAPRMNARKFIERDFPATRAIDGTF
jgi:hypothetical protein